MWLFITTLTAHLEVHHAKKHPLNTTKRRPPHSPKKRVPHALRSLFLHSKNCPETTLSIHPTTTTTCRKCRTADCRPEGDSSTQTFARQAHSVHNEKEPLPGPAREPEEHVTATLQLVCTSHHVNSLGNWLHSEHGKAHIL